MGLILGYIIGNLLIPIIAKEIKLSDSISISFSPFIFLFASVFSLITVFISSRKPGKIAGKVSPIEATKIGDINELNYSKEKRTEKEVKIDNMAIANLSRNKLRTITVILSMSLSLVLFNTIYTFTNSFDSEKYVDGFMNADFSVGSVEYFKYRYREEKDSTPANIINSIERTEGFKNGGRIYYNDFQGIEIEDNSIMELEGKRQVQVFGLDDFLILKQRIVEGSIDIEKFMSGNYVLLGVYNENTLNPKNLKYKVGDKVTLITKEGKREFKIMALIEYNYNNSARFYPVTLLEDGQRIKGELMYIPAAIYKEMTQDSSVMVYQFDVDDEKRSDFEVLLTGLSESPTLDLDYESRRKLIDEYDGFKDMFLVVGSALSIIIGIVGVMNFVNSIITSIIARKKELALLQSIGMTNKQVNSLLVKEGIIYSLLTMITTSILAILLSLTILKSFERGMPFYTYKFTVLPLLVSLPLIILLGFVVPLLVNRIMIKESIVERIRE